MYFTRIKEYFDENIIERENISSFLAFYALKNPRSLNMCIIPIGTFSAFNTCNISSRNFPNPKETMPSLVFILSVQNPFSDRGKRVDIKILICSG